MKHPSGWNHRQSFVQSGGSGCAACGMMGHEHTKKKVNYGGGLKGYRLLCPLPEEL